MKITIHFYHEQYDWEATGVITASSFKYDDKTTGVHRRIRLTSHEIEIPDIEPLTPAQLSVSFIDGLHVEADQLQSAHDRQMLIINKKIVEAESSIS
jgi:hypothetical protein